MNHHRHRLVVGFAFGLLLSACKERPEPPNAASVTRPQIVKPARKLLHGVVGPTDIAKGSPFLAGTARLDTGFRRITLGSVDMQFRAEQKVCPTTPDDPDPDPAANQVAPSSECRTNSDCREKPYGLCVSESRDNSAPPHRHRCAYGCVADSDCVQGAVCVCDGGYGTCAANLCPESGCGESELCSTCATVPNHPLQCHTKDSAEKECFEPIQ